jgi:hypothetical protein
LLLKPRKSEAAPSGLLVAAASEGYKQQRGNISRKALVEECPIETLARERELERYEGSEPNRQTECVGIPARRDPPNEQAFEPGANGFPSYACDDCGRCKRSERAGNEEDRADAVAMPNAGTVQQLQDSANVKTKKAASGCLSTNARTLKHLISWFACA